MDRTRSADLRLKLLSHFRTGLFNALTLLLFLITCSKIASQTANTGNPSDEFKLSFTERIRIETWDNAVTLSNSAKAGTSYSRIRTSVMGQWFPNQDMEIGVKLTNEFRNYFSPSTNAFHMNEIFFDQLYIKWKLTSLSGTLTLGRQNIMLGEGFLVMDGSPLDGSRSIYFNAIRYDWNINPTNTFTILGTYMPKTENILPVLNGTDIDASYQGDGSYTLIEQSEIGSGFYYTGIFDKLNLQAYYLRKDYVDPDTKLLQVKSGINSIGSRANYLFSPMLSGTAEGAYQFGRNGNSNHSSYGGYAYLDFSPKQECNFIPKTITIGTIYLSGDDPKTTDNEGWDPIFSRWPKWSESYIYTQIKEFGGKVGMWSNLASLYATLKFNLDEQFNFSFDYHHLTAPQAAPAGSFPGGTGSTRGDLFIAKLLFDVNKNVSGHILIEHFIPGNYYFKGANSYNWGRIEFTFKL